MRETKSEFSSVQFISAEDGIEALGKGHNYKSSTSSFVDVSPISPLKEFQCSQDVYHSNIEQIKNNKLPMKMANRKQDAELKKSRGE